MTAETAPDAPDAPEIEPEAEPETGTDEVAKWKALSRKNEAAAKKLADELAAERKQHETDQERAFREAVEAARNETLKEVSGDRVADAIRVATANRQVDVETLIEGVDVGRFLGDDGRPDIEKVNQWVAKVAPESTPEPNPFPDVGQGHTGAGTPALNSSQLEADLRRAVGAS